MIFAPWPNFMLITYLLLPFYFFMESTARCSFVIIHNISWFCSSAMVAILWPQLLTNASLVCSSPQACTHERARAATRGPLPSLILRSSSSGQLLCRFGSLAPRDRLHVVAAKSFHHRRRHFPLRIVPDGLRSAIRGPNISRINQANATA